jgi:hypothetical protein
VLIHNDIRTRSASLFISHLIAPCRHPPLVSSRSLSCSAGARFYITNGAACRLTARRALVLRSCSPPACLSWALAHLAGVTCPGGLPPALLAAPPPDYAALEEYLYRSAVRLQLPVHQLTAEALGGQVSGSGTSTSDCPDWLKDEATCQVLVACAARRLRCAFCLRTTRGYYVCCYIAVL